MRVTSACSVVLIALASLLFWGGCGASGTTEPRADRGGSEFPAQPDAMPPQDIGVPYDAFARDTLARDTLSPDTTPGCVVGSADNCARCGDKCAGPVGTQHTQRVCLSPNCDIQCLDEYYDVNGQAVDGCEAMDDVPSHDTEQSASSMGSASDCDANKKTQAVMPSDDRLHLKAPTQRTNGRADWFKLKIADNFGCTVNAAVKVSLAALHPSASFRVTAHYICNDDTRLAQQSTAIQGGQSASLSPDTGCSFGGFGDDGGTVYVSVTKLVGQHSAGNYSVEIEP